MFKSPDTENDSVSAVWSASVAIVESYKSSKSTPTLAECAFCSWRYLRALLRAILYIQVENCAICGLNWSFLK